VLILNISIILIITAFCYIHTYRRQDKISCMTGMKIAMITAMMSSLPISFILGVLYPADLEAVTVASVLLGMTVGFLSGKCENLMAAMDGMASGIMSGLMGAMMGVMIANPLAVILLMDFIFAVMATTVILLIREEMKLYHSLQNQKTEPSQNQ
jgi:hypothetical protein